MLKCTVPYRNRSAAKYRPAQESEDPISDLAGLRTDQLLEEAREFAVYLADAPQIPGMLAEIGRLRELIFRAVGEDTGKATDLDRFDSYYSPVRARIALPLRGPGGLNVRTMRSFFRDLDSFSTIVADVEADLREFRFSCGNP